MTIKMRLRMEMWHGNEYTKFKMCFSMTMFICIKQHLTKTWSSIHEKVKQHWGWVEKSVAYKKLVVAYIKKAYRKIKETQHVELVQQRNRQAQDWKKKRFQ